MNFSPTELAAWLGILFFLVGGVNQARQLWMSATDRFSVTSSQSGAITRGEFNERMTRFSQKFDTQIANLTQAIQRVDRRQSRTNASLSQLIGVISARDGVRVPLPTEDDIS